MQEELLQFKHQKGWTLVDLPNGKREIGTKWIFRNKKDERGIIVRNKARLVAQGYTQEDGIDYDEVFAPVARIEVIMLFLAYASFMGFIVYQIDVKSAFLYGTIEEEVYIYQPPGFEDPHFLDKVYKVEKDLYGLHQAPRAWYETLSTYLIENRFRRGTIDKTLFIKKDKGDILLVQVYVDDIIFGSTKKSLYDEFKGLMHNRFQMSNMGELTFFLGLQVQQKEDGIFISQEKYVAKILKKFDFSIIKKASTPIETNKALVKDEEAEAVNVHLYRSMIRSLMYLTTSRPDIIYLKGQPKLGLWYPKDSPFDLEVFSDSDYAGASIDRKSITGEYVAAANCCGQVPSYHIGGAKAQTRFEAASKQSNDPPLSRVYTLESGEDSIKLLELMELCTKLSDLQRCQLQALVDKKKVIITETSISSDLHLEDAGGTDCLPTGTIFKELARMWRKQKKNTIVPYPSDSTADVLNEEHVPTYSNDPLLSEKKAGLRTHKFKRLYKVGVTRRVESLDDESLGAQEDASKQGRSRIESIDKDDEVTLVETQRRNDENDDNLMFDIGVFDGDEIVVETEEPVINAATTTKEHVESTITTTVPSQKSKDKGKAIMIEPEKPLKKKDQIKLDEELAREIKDEEQAESERIQKDRATQEEASRAAIYEEWDNEQAMMEVDYEKRAKDNQELESSKRKRVEDDKKEDELKRCFELATEEDIAINVIPLATKVPVVGFQIHTRGKPVYYEIFRADGSSKLYHVFSQLLSEFDIEDLVNLWKLVKAKHGDNRPEEDFERVLWGDLRVKFEPDVESEIQKMNIKFRGGLLGLKGFLKLLLLSTAGTKVNAAGLQLLEELLLRNKKEELFILSKEMDLETIQTNAVVKLPLLKQENGNSFKPVPRTAQNADVTSTTMIPGAITIEEKAQKKNDVKARISILGENISQEDLNLKFLRSLPFKWNTHVVVWRNKPDLDSISFDDLYSNFKIVEQEVKRTASSNSSSNSQNMAFVSTHSSTNEVNTANVQVSTANSSVNTDSTQDKQIHEDNLEEMDLKWQLALLSMRARRNPRSQESRPRNHDHGNRNQDSSRRTVNVEETAPKAMVAIDGSSFDWSFMAEEEVTTNMALMAFSDSKVYTDKTFSNTCLKSFETLKTQLDNLRVEFNKFEFNLATYKRGLASVEEQLVFYKKNEVMFSDQIVVLKRDTSFKDSETIALKNEIEKLKKDKNSNQNKTDKFENASSTSTEVKKTTATPLVEELVSEKEKQTFFPTKIEFVKQQDKTARKPVKVNYNYTTNRTHPNAQRNMVPRAVLMKTGLKPFNTAKTGKPLMEDKGFVDSGCSRHMTGNIAYLSDFKEFDGGYVTFGGGHMGEATQALDNLSKFGWQNDEGFFVGYSLSSKAFRLATLEQMVEENLHIRFLENKPMIERNGPKWLFDNDSLTQSMNYVPVAAGTITNESAYTQGELNVGTSTQKEEIKFKIDCDSNWKDASYFDSPSKDVGNGDPKSVVDDQKQVEDGPHNESDLKDKSDDDSSPKEVNTARQHVNTASLKKSFCSSSSNKYGNLWICLMKRGPLEQNGSLETRKMKDGLRLGIKIDHTDCFLAYASFMGFLVYQMDVKSAFLYGTIEEEVYVSQAPRFKDPDSQTKVYNGVPSAFNRVASSSKSMKFNYTNVKSASTPVDLEKTLVKDGDADDVDGFSIELVAYTDMTMLDATQDRKSTTGSSKVLLREATYVNMHSSMDEQDLLEFCDKHNMVAYLEKSEGSEGFHQIIDFLTVSHIKTVLTECPTLYASPIEQFWQTATLSTNEDRVRGITATIDKKVKKVASLESELKQTKQTYNAALIKLINMEVPSNQGRSLIEELDLDAKISLVPPHAANQGRINDTQISDQPEEQLGVFSAATALADAARRRQSVENV
ncbi:putative ribonuclease H-like domain-containing protein [Tanacetum coccineum]